MFFIPVLLQVCLVDIPPQLSNFANMILFSFMTLQFLYLLELTGSIWKVNLSSNKFTVSEVRMGYRGALARPSSPVQSLTDP